jgi:hypothetical protein
MMKNDGDGYRQEQSVVPVSFILASPILLGLLCRHK